MSQEVDKAPEATADSTADNIANDNIANIEPAVNALSTLEPAANPDPPDQKEATPLNLCAPPSDAVGPDFTIPFRTPVLSPLLHRQVPFDPPGTINGGLFPPSFACVATTQVQFYLAIDLRLEQLWNLTALHIGDLSSTISLAPSEHLTLEFQHTQRRVLDQQTVNSAEELTSTESITADKDVLNTVRSSSESSNWHVDGSASYSIAGATVGIQAGYSHSTTQSAQTTINHVSESTTKSAHNLKTLHKVEVRGVSEGIVQNRMTRTIKNPYPDRTLSLNVFEVLKTFSIKTQLAEIRPVLIFQVDGLNFDQQFVKSNTDFLRDNLLDPALVDNLPTALLGADPLPKQSREAAINAAKLALQYFFDVETIFNLPDLKDGDVAPYDVEGHLITHGQNNPKSTFNADIIQLPVSERQPLPPNAPPGALGPTKLAGNTGFGDAVAKDLGVIFTTINFFYKVYKDLSADPAVFEDGTKLDRNAVALVSALHGSISKPWRDFQAQPNIAETVRNILDTNDFTEAFRRLSGFLAMVEGMVYPLIGIEVKVTQVGRQAGDTGPPQTIQEEVINEAEALARQAQEEAERELNRLLNHLACNKNYYTQRFLEYRAKQTNNQAVVDFIEEAEQNLTAGAISPDTLTDHLHTLFDTQSAFIDKQQIVIPAHHSLDEQQMTAFANAVSSDESAFNLNDIKPVVLPDVQVPADGIHLEVAEGTCLLKDVPSQGGTTGPGRARYYVVQQGDTLDAIAQRFGTTAEELAQLNSIEDPNTIFPGQILDVPVDSVSST